MTSTYSPSRAPDRTQDPRGRPPSRLRAPLTGLRRIRPLTWQRAAACLLPALLVAYAGFQRRWMSDDGYIYLRTVRQILAGHGPVFNAGERAEASTGTLWQWLLVLAGLPGTDPASAAVYGGLLLTAAGFLCAAAGAARLHTPGPLRQPLVPLGALLPLALPPVWDFATSGLETGLITCWLGGSWLLLVTRPERLATCAVAGLGPLVRPDLALVSAVFLAAQWLRVRPPRRTVLTGAACALALPLAYEVFRAGYYGHLVPLPAVTKEASDSLWGRGLGYLGDFAGPYLLWVPALLLAAALLPRRRPLPPVPVAALAPVVAGLVNWLYVVRVGGDFMHGRMLLPGLLLLVLPVFVVPASRRTLAAAAALAVWATCCAGWLRPAYQGRIGPAGIADERGVYARQNASAHPVHHHFPAAPRLTSYARTVRAADRSGTPTLLLDGHRVPAAAPGVTGVHVMLGFDGATVPLSGAALDPIGLGYPLAAHSQREGGGRVGHDKHLPAAWIAADRGAPGTVAPGVDAVRVAAARHALGCGPLPELRAATRAPLTPARFWHNLTGSWQRTVFRFPDDPARAERQLCGKRPMFP
ncbi:hypothetical protein [Streptomyces sp. NPDC058045]|uniref:hypothetical protein n=1 Tax=Streptomyces sp. NPDC058045 TaxID=3346311 RepID=UPI0036EDFDE8